MEKTKKVKIKNYKQEESQNKESTERDRNKDINRNKGNRQALPLQQEK